MLSNTCVITFANTDVHKEYQKEFDTLYKHEFALHIPYTESDIIGTDFYYNNMQVFQYTKYFGYFLWKPYLILKTLRDMGDFNVLYCDSNLRFTNFGAFENAYKTMMEVQDVFLVKHEHFINREWTKRDTFFMMDADNERYWNAHQVWTPLMGFGTSSRTNELLAEYLHYCRHPQIVTEEPNKSGENLPGFKEHRWEQSVMSILAERHGYNGIRDTQVMSWVTKLYSEELMKLKARINENPLDKSVQLF